MIKWLAVFLLVLWPMPAIAEPIVDTDMYFHYCPKKLSDGTRDTNLTVGTVSDLDIFVYLEDDATYGSAETEDTTACPAEASEVCMDHQGNGCYAIGVDAALNTTSGKKLCVDVQDTQGTPTVFDFEKCEEISAVVSTLPSGACLSDATTTSTVCHDTTGLVSGAVNALRNACLEIDAGSGIWEGIPIKASNSTANTVTTYRAFSADLDGATYRVTRGNCR